jgi:hypothetical protein
MAGVGRIVKCHNDSRITRRLYCGYEIAVTGEYVHMLLLGLVANLLQLSEPHL